MKNLPKLKNTIRLLLLIFLTLSFGNSCKGSKEKKNTLPEQAGIILGFSQIGEESAWRKCNTRSVKEAALESGVQLVFANAEQKQENQIKAIRSFIAYLVDVIAFVPIVADGWDNVLREAKDAGIPVLITDRKINTADNSLYAGFIGTDSLEEGRNAALFLIKKFGIKPGESGKEFKPINIVELSGTEGSSVATGRAAGFREVLDEYPQFNIIHSESGDFLRSKGYELMHSILGKYKNIDVVFSHNDGMTLGIIDAMTEKGIKPGKDIVIVTIDAEQAAIDALRLGKVNFVIECNPKMGPEIMDLVQRLVAGERIPRLQHVDEQVFYETDDLSILEPRGY
ncbi:ABC transporter substrate-binding protein [Oceanispirochaeta sp.]|jgi:ABC-type sugar transport system substrate-binding protein|uniref:ABC transporter substrate-binding protein n=1 Tax=Oceanispirochaeta sp. TaxID=2035350 RepID=UPI002634B1CC|nr:ABC transporter substrate-binding protein [Oceanispirochaeta sp.]MDA3958628.1 ABC transporter substrate-binding protein [Oceanispirochaeta sp.]